MDILDAYSVKKIAPRLLFAAIAINLSIYLVIMAIDITNVVGGGMADLIRAPIRSTNAFDDLQIPDNTLNEALGVGSVVGIVGIGGGAAAGVGFFQTIVSGSFALASGAIEAALMFLAVAALMAILIAIAIMATLVIRYGAILFLAMVAPVAIALLVLPGTEKYFKTWWSVFFKTLLMYPIIAVIFAVSDVLGALLLATLGNQNSVIALVGVFVVVFAVYAPLFMIPFAFKLAGGIVGAVYDFANKNGSGRLNERINNWKKDPNSWYGGAANKRKGDRYARGLSGSQIGSGLSGFASGVKNGEGGLRSRFQEGSRRYQRKSQMKGALKNWKLSKEAQENLDEMPFLEGNDDVNELMNEMVVKGNMTHAEKEQILSKKNSDMYGNWGRYTDAQGQTRVGWRQGSDETGWAEASAGLKAAQAQQREEAIALAESAKSKMGDQVASIFAGQQAAKATTFANNGDSEQLATMAQDTGGPMLLQQFQAQAMKSNQKALNRLDTGGGSSAKQFTLMTQLKAGEIDEQQFAEAMAESATEKITPGAIIGQDHNGMAAFVKAYKRRMENAVNGGDYDKVQKEAANMQALYENITYSSVENKEDLIGMFNSKDMVGTGTTSQFTGKSAWEVMEDIKGAKGQNEIYNQAIRVWSQERADFEHQNQERANQG